MIFDKDFSFLRLRDNFDDAKNMGESPQASILYNSQVRLSKGETYFQISNSPTSIVFNDNYDVYLVDCSGNEIENITPNIFLEEFFDSNGIKQIAWEYICDSEHYFKDLSFRFRNTINNDVWYTNLVNITECDKELTTRFDYKHFENHYGTQYERADYYQSIRLAVYFRHPVNEDTREEYHEITTNNTSAQRNIKKRKRKYILNDTSSWINERIDNMITCSYLYADFWKMTNTTPIEFNEPEMDSNISEGELLLNPSLTYETYTFAYQFFDGFTLLNFNPSGFYATGYAIDAMSVDGSADLTLHTGTLSVYNSGGTLIHSFDESDMVIQAGNQLKIITTSTPVQSLPNDTYYVNMTQGLVSGLGIGNEAITDNTTWTFTFREPDFLQADFNNNDFFTN